MVTNRVSATLDSSELQTMMAAIATIPEKLSFFAGLTPEERKSLLKMADTNEAFARRALEVATQTPDFLPCSFDLEEMQRDLTLFTSLQPVILAVTQLQEMLTYTATAAGNEAYTAALEVYRYAKANGTMAGLDDLVEKLGEWFTKRANPKGSQPVTE
ncbi:hypothetical protein XM38_047080 [Halomicronema hongdechloris C2206]|uniref:Uncharacterized protein n=1 Tax=Halomicronema hongdechloris C2206 TaxID=1641165 RepID=A0A1Z3HTZ6_9CYAN|nr:hypothetical protein [Halomicronema hongdechloris]ASC73736.1 hypothetical protein XM38_047080 [Halomicronema hongdechloris C2206]